VGFPEKKKRRKKTKMNSLNNRHKNWKDFHARKKDQNKEAGK